MHSRVDPAAVVKTDELNIQEAGMPSLDVEDSGDWTVV